MTIWQGSEDFGQAFADEGATGLAREGTWARQEQEYLMKVIAESLQTCPLAVEELQRLRAHSAVHYEHSLRVGLLWRSVLNRDDEVLGYLEKTADTGALHDVGKIFIPLEILEGKELSTPEQIGLMKAHNELSVRVLVPMEPYFPGISKVLPLHHAGYPRGGKHDRREGERRYIEVDIPANIDYRKGERREEERREQLHPLVVKAGGLLALADTYDALASRRSYKEPWPEERMKTELARKYPTLPGEREYLFTHFPVP